LSRVNKRRGGEEVKTKVRGILKQCSHFTLFLTICLLPFITITQYIGIDAFIDSFEHAESYDYIKNPHCTAISREEDSHYVFIQCSSHPTFQLKPGDRILFYGKQGIEASTVETIQQEPILKIYTTATFTTNQDFLYEYDVIGKIIGSFDDNLWNSLSITLWETSISTLNVHAMLSRD